MPKTDMYDNNVAMPRWELSDPFGRGAIRKARWEYTQVRHERDALKNELEALYGERGKAVNMLIDALYKEQQRSDELTRRLGVCDEARKSLGEKINSLDKANGKLSTELANLEDEYNELSRNYELLLADHEKLIRSMTDGGAVE